MSYLLLFAEKQGIREYLIGMNLRIPDGTAPGPGRDGVESSGTHERQILRIRISTAVGNWRRQLVAHS